MRAGAPAPARPAGVLSEPSFGAIFRTGAAGFLREGLLPLGAFYAGLRLAGLVAGVAAAAVASLLLYLHERRAGREGLLVRLSLAFVVVQSCVGLLADSATVYLAQPVLVAAAWGVAFVASVPLGRPLAGTFACAWYPFPPAVRGCAEFRRVFGRESLVWGGYFLARSALRLALLLHGSLESFVVVTFLSGTPAMLVLLAWSVRYALRALAD